MTWNPKHGGNPYGQKPDPNRPGNGGVVWKLLLDLPCKICRAETKHFTTDSSGTTKIVCMNPHNDGVVIC